MFGAQDQGDLQAEFQGGFSSVADCIRERRQQLEASFIDSAANIDTRASVVHVVVVGDDSRAKASLLDDYFRRVDSSAEGKDHPCPWEARVTRPLVGTQLLVLAPPSDNASSHLRQEVLRAAQVVICVFSVTNAGSLDAVRTRWIDELRAAGDGEPHCPIVLVGGEAQVRANPTEGDAASFVSASAAVSAAQEIGASKYVEVHTNSPVHAVETFVQALRVAAPGHSSRCFAARTALRECLRCSIPAGHFDMGRRGFALLPATDRTDVVTFTTDGSDPRCSTTARAVNDGFIPLHHQRLLLAARGACMFPSEVVEVEAPPTVAPPRGWFGADSKSCTLEHPDPTAELHFTVDGTDPDEGSRRYVNPIALDDAPRPLRGILTPLFVESHNAVPKRIRVRAFAAGFFPSDIVEIPVPQVIETPKISFNPSDGMLSVANYSPLFEYRYTVDGSTPSTANGILYTRPVLLASSGVSQIRIAAFPRLYLPSVEAVVDARHQDRDIPRKAIPATRSMVLRAESLRQFSDGNTSVSAVERLPKPVDTPRSAFERGTSPRSKSTTVVGPAIVRGPRRSPARVASPKPAADPKPARRRVSTPTGTPRKVGSGEAKGNTQRTALPNKKKAEVSCQAKDNRVVFDFPTPIHLSHITITTPGHARGPESYEVVVLPTGHNQQVSIGMGDLQDLEGVQTMHVVTSARAMSLTQVVCVLRGPSGFEVTDMKIHGRPNGLSDS